ncbi:hypothetical protein KY321_05140 [Candidatus Woesearchaeota archaeon]|nr:hypothetical protein [Candidatus Woesearchaeota archaeon]
MKTNLVIDLDMDSGVFLTPNGYKRITDSYSNSNTTIAYLIDANGQERICSILELGLFNMELFDLATQVEFNFESMVYDFPLPSRNDGAYAWVKDEEQFIQGNPFLCFPQISHIDVLYGEHEEMSTHDLAYRPDLKTYTTMNIILKQFRNGNLFNKRELANPQLAYEKLMFIESVSEKLMERNLEKNFFTDKKRDKLNQRMDELRGKLTFQNLASKAENYHTKKQLDISHDCTWPFLNGLYRPLSTLYKE